MANILPIHRAKTIQEMDLWLRKALSISLNVHEKDGMFVLYAME